MRSSPVVCAVNTAQIFAQLAFDFWQTDSFRDAIAHIIDDRFGEVEAVEEGSLASLRRTIVARWTVFGLSRATKVVKLFAFSGVLGTKLCATAYVASWAVVEVLVFYATFRNIAPSRHRNQIPGWILNRKWQGTTFAMWLEYLAAFIQYILTIIAMVTAGRSWFFDSESGFTDSEKIFTKILWLPTVGLVDPMMFAGIVMMIPFGLLGVFRINGVPEAIIIWSCGLPRFYWHTSCIGYVISGSSLAVATRLRR